MNMFDVIQVQYLRDRLEVERAVQAVRLIVDSGTEVYTIEGRRPETAAETHRFGEALSNKKACDRLIRKTLEDAQPPSFFAKRMDQYFGKTYSGEEK